MQQKIVRACVGILMSAWSAGAQPVPTSRLAVANWQTAGVTPNGGIPARATICSTILAATYNNGADDASARIQAAVNACPVGQTVLLGAGTFKVIEEPRLARLLHCLLYTSDAADE